jgi:hypothetical protein
MTKFKKTAGAATKYLVIRISSLIRHSSFVITRRHSGEIYELDET